MGMRGRLVTVEGVDGAGKSTHVAMLRAYLTERGVPHLYVREPGGTVGGERLRLLLLDPAGAEWHPVAEALLFAAARAQLVHERLRPALQAGTLVLCDRYVDSSLAYQGFAAGAGVEVVRAINEYATAGLRPDLTILFDLGPAAARARRDRAPDRVERRGEAFHTRVREGYLALARAEPDRFVVIDASRPVEEVQRRARAALEPLLPPCEPA